MGSLTDHWERVALDLILGPTTRGANASETVPATVYIGLYTTNPADDGTGGTEVSGGSYARVAVTNNATNFPAAATSTGTSSKSNGTSITFPTATANWGTVVGFGIFDASTSGTLIAYGSLSSSVAVNSGNQASFGANALTATCD